MNTTLLRWIVPLTLGAAACVEADSIYVVDKPGQPLFFTNRVDGLSSNAMLFNRRTVRVSSRQHRKNPKLFLDRFRAEIAAASREHNIDSDLVTAVIHAESSFNPLALSPKGARGLMQVMPTHTQGQHDIDLFEPADNIRTGTGLLAQLTKKFGGDERKALAAYNAGETAVRRHNGIPPYPETQAYVERVLKLRAAYSEKRSRA